MTTPRSGSPTARLAASAVDLAFCVAYDGHLAASALERKLADRELVVAELDGELAGLLRLDHLWSIVPHVAQVRVLERHRRRGVGRALVAFAADQARAGGANVLLSSTRPDKAAAQAWHRALGFVECGSLAGMGPSGEPVIVYRKDL